MRCAHRELLDSSFSDILQFGLRLDLYHGPVSRYVDFTHVEKPASD